MGTLLKERLRILERENRHLRRLCTHDPLTELLNRRGLEQALDREWKRAMRRQTPIAFLMTDIDFFKRYNDAAGHLAGDQCLSDVAKVISRSTLRAEDLAARYGGEEFALVLPDVTLYGAKTVAERLLRHLTADQLSHPDSPLGPYITLSVGIAWTAPMESDLWEPLVQAADQALYHAKESGRNQLSMLCLKRAQSHSVSLLEAS